MSNAQAINGSLRFVDTGTGYPHRPPAWKRIERPPRRGKRDGLSRLAAASRGLRLAAAADQRVDAIEVIALFPTADAETLFPVTASLLAVRAPGRAWNVAPLTRALICPLFI